MHLNVLIRDVAFVIVFQAGYVLDIARISTRTVLNVFCADGYLEPVYTCVEFFL